MKKTMIALGLAAVFVGSQVNNAEARGFHDPVLGAVIGGLMAGAVIVDAVVPHPVYCAPAPQPVYCAPAPRPVYCPPQVVYAPAPAYYYAQPAPVYYREPFVRVGFGFGRDGFGRDHRDYRHDRWHH